MQVLLTMLYNNVKLNIIYSLYAGYTVSAHIIFMENRLVDPGSVEGNHRPYVLHEDKIHNTRERPCENCETEYYY